MPRRTMICKEVVCSMDCVRRDQTGWSSAFNSDACTMPQHTTPETTDYDLRQEHQAHAPCLNILLLPHSRAWASARDGILDM